MEKKADAKKITLMAFGVVLNVVGAFIAFNLRLPIYLDSVGTVMIAILLGPKQAVITGLSGSLVSGMTFDVYSLYFAPVQITTGLIAGIMSEKGFLEGKKTLIGIFMFALPTAIISSIISAYLFGGITSSGSSYIVQILNVIGMPDVLSVFITQIFTDYADEILALSLVKIGISALPKNAKISMNINR